MSGQVSAICEFVALLSKRDEGVRSVISTIGEIFFKQEQDFKSIKEVLPIERRFLPLVEMTA